MKILIYDLSSSYEVRVIESENNSKIFTYKMPPALIRDDSLHDNSKCSLFDPDNPDFSAFIKMCDGEALRFEYDNEKLLTLTEIMYSLCWNKIQNFSPVENYFKAVSKLVNAILKKKMALTVGQTILLVPDALPLEGQQKLLSYFGRNKTRLLWHSVAISLGNEELLRNCEDKASVAIVDEFSNIGFFTSKIEIKKEGARAIPCHKIYQKSNGEISKWYLRQQEENIRNVLNTKVKYKRLTYAYGEHKEDECVSIDYSGLPVRKPTPRITHLYPVKIQNAALVISSPNSTVYGLPRKDIEIKCNIEESGFAGAVKFYEYTKTGQIPYYDECESFSVICENDKEEITYFELIKANYYLPGGKKTEGTRTDNLCIPKGSKNAQFYFHLGDINNNYAQLRHFIQEFPIEKPLEENRTLLLSPSVIPGQGYAEVLIEDNNSDKLFPPIELDWEHMKLALENGEKVTKTYLEKHLERSFPPDVPPVVSRFAISGVGGPCPSEELQALVKLDLKYGMFYNRSTWPNINDSSKGVERFVRQNVFGAYSEKKGHKYSFPKVSGVSEQDYISAFNSIAEKYNDNSNSTKHIGKFFMGTDDDIVPYLAWSYLRFDAEGNLISQLTKATNKVIRVLGEKDNYACPAAYASYLANMIVLQEEFERVFTLFYRALRYKAGGVSNWCRAMYQILMYTPFIYSKSAIISKYVGSCMRELAKRLTDEVDNEKWKAVDNILRVMLYLLKRRVIDKRYCKKDNSDGLYTVAMEALCHAKEKIEKKDRFLENTIKTIIKYINGAGTLDGIPLL